MLEDSSTRNTISALFWPHTEETQPTGEYNASPCDKPDKETHSDAAGALESHCTDHKTIGQNTWTLCSCWMDHSGCGWFVWRVPFSGLSGLWLTLRLLCCPGFGGWHCYTSMLSGLGDSGRNMRGHSGWHRLECHHRRILSFWDIEMMWQKWSNIFEKISIS